MASGWKVLAPIDLRFDTEAPVQYAQARPKFSAQSLFCCMSPPHAGTSILTAWDGRRARGASAPPDWTYTDSSFQAGVGYDRPVRGPHRCGHVVDDNSHLRADARRFWSRSITAEVMDSTQRPVCITKMIDVDSNLRFRCQSILCVVGLEGQDADVIQQSQEIAGRSDAELILLHIVPEISEGLLAYGVVGPREDRSRRNLRERRLPS